MAVATEVSSVNLNPANQPARGFGGAIDSSLFFSSGVTVTATGNSAVISVEGGSFAEFVALVSAITTDETYIPKLQFSRDGGTTWKDLATFRQAVAADNGIPLGWVVYIPKPSGTNRLTQLRVARTLGGTTISMTVTEFLRPLGYGADTALENV